MPRRRKNKTSKPENVGLSTEKVQSTTESSKVNVCEYNLDFHSRKSDRCDSYEAYRVSRSQNIVTADQKELYEKHIAEKTAIRENRKMDRENKDVPQDSLCKFAVHRNAKKKSTKKTKPDASVPIWRLIKPNALKCKPTLGR
ncbi:hypothetical protein J6590_044627 [Homalodisca vitripennis]|nr:hypothetical protein J6590_044627 [Homalodisca vitripennis]